MTSTIFPAKMLTHPNYLFTDESIDFNLLSSVNARVNRRKF